LKNKQKLNEQNSVTVAFGYGLFVLTSLSVVLWTIIPLGAVLFNPHPATRHFNVAVLLILFVAASILPALGSYILGDRATHLKNRALHHYNGVLFAIAAYWVASVFTFIGFSQFVPLGNLPIPLPSVIAVGVPIILAIAVMTFIAITYAKQQKNKPSVLEHRPYQIVLVGSALWFFVSMAMSSSYSLNDTLWYGIVSLAYPVVLTAASYRILAKHHSSRLASLTDAVVAMGFGSITLTLFYSFVSYLNLPNATTFILSYTFALVVWIAYLYLRNRKSA
jgi:hypothetical protein